MVEPTVMTGEEVLLADRIGEQFVKLLPDRSYLCLALALGGQTAVRRSLAGDYAGWNEEWMFDDVAMAQLSFVLRLRGHAPVGWTRHIWMDEHGVSQREYPRGG
jgi:hypothetical protein